MTDKNEKKDATAETDDLQPVMQFPMNFPVKIMGLNNPAFPGVIADLTKEHFSDFDKGTLKIEFSKTKKYMALTVTVNAQSREQLDGFYLALTSNPMVKVAL